VVPLSAQHGMFSDSGWRDGLKPYRVAVNTLHKQPWMDDTG
jgi:hypothetical protein